jgi:vanillate/3-O-methylgallate O-demethylase
MTDPMSAGFTPETTLQQALDAVGGPLQLLWKPGSPNIEVPVVPQAFTDWQVEQRAATQSVALLDVSHHMNDLFIEGPDATKVLASSSANNYENFAIGQAKQFIAVTNEGWLLQDAILARRGENTYVLTGIGTTHSWVIFHAVTSGADVQFSFDPSSDLRGPADPRIFRYQIQGPRALEMLTPIFGDQLDEIRFFHEKAVVLDGRRFSALRHGMAGEAGFEFIGPWEISGLVKDALLAAGEPFGLQQVGGRVYYTLGVDSGWLATPLPGIYEGRADAGFRSFTKVFSYEGMMALQGSYFSANISDYYVNPYELGYGRSINLDHEFTGRDALAARKGDVRRKKVTLVWNEDDVNRVFGADRDIVRSYTKDRVLLSDATVGMSEYAASSARENTIHSIARVDVAHSAPGTDVELHWGQHPGLADPGFSDFQTIRATVQPAPYHEYARSGYRGAN